MIPQPPQEHPLSFTEQPPHAGAFLDELVSPSLAPLFRRPQLPLSCRIRLGRRFEPPSNVQAFTAEIEAYFRAELGENGASPAPASA